MIWCLQFSPVQCRCARLALLSWIRNRPRKPDVPVAGCGQYGLEESISVEPPTLTVQDASDRQGAIVYDCRPPMLHVSLRLEDIGPLPLRRTVVSASLAAPPLEDSMAIGGATLEGGAILELGVAPLFDDDTDLEDELPTPEGSMLIGDFSPEGVRLLSVSVLPAIVTPLVEPGEVFPVASVCVSGASCSCSAGHQSMCYVAGLSTPGGSRRPDPLCVPVIPDFALSFHL